MISSLCAVAIVVLAAGSAQPVKLASPGLSSVNLKEDLASFYSDHLAQQLTLEGVRVITASEISTLLGFERQKELLGCSEKSSSCIAELANALGVDGIVSGSLGKFGKSYQVNIKILAANDGRPLSAYSARVEGDEALLDELNRAARKMTPEVLAALRRAPVAQVPPVAANPAPSAVPAGQTVAQTDSSSAVWRKWSLLPLAAGGLFLGASGLLAIQSNQEAAKLRNPANDLTIAQAVSARTKGEQLQNQARFCAFFGIAGLATAGVMYWWLGAPKAASTVSLTPSADGATLVFSGPWP